MKNSIPDKTVPNKGINFITMSSLFSSAFAMSKYVEQLFWLIYYSAPRR